MSVHVFTWNYGIGISNKKSLVSFVHDRLDINPASYTHPCFTIWGSVPDVIIATQVNISLLCQKNHVVNKTFTNLIKFLTRIISFLSPFIWCIIVAQIFNRLNLYPALKMYWHRNFIIVVWPSHHLHVDGSTTTTTDTILENTGNIVWNIWQLYNIESISIWTTSTKLAIIQVELFLQVWVVRNTLITADSVMFCITKH